MQWEFSNFLQFQFDPLHKSLCRIFRFSYFVLSCFWLWCLSWNTSVGWVLQSNRAWLTGYKANDLFYYLRQELYKLHGQHFSTWGSLRCHSCVTWALLGCQMGIWPFSVYTWSDSMMCVLLVKLWEKSGLLQNNSWRWFLCLKTFLEEQACPLEFLKCGRWTIKG